MRKIVSADRKPLFVSLAAAAFGALLLALYVRQFERDARGGDLVGLLALRKDVSAEQPLDEQALVVRTLPETYLDGRHVLASDLTRVLGIRAASDLKANQWLLWSDLETSGRDVSSLSTRIPKGMRAFPVAQTRLAEHVLPGDRVDVLFTKPRPGHESGTVTVALLQSSLVLAVGQNARAGYDPGALFDHSSVTLLVTIEQASLLAQAQRSGELTLILRNEDDLEIKEGLAETDDSDILELEERERRQRRSLIERVE